MKKTIWKYELKTVDEQFILMPTDAKILSLQTQNNRPCIWALVDPSEKMNIERHFEIFGTGHPIRIDINVDATFIGTYQLHDGALVFHVFERIL